jgi:hypothetical protein
MISALLLSTSLPMQVLAQKVNNKGTYADYYEEVRKANVTKYYELGDGLVFFEDQVSGEITSNKGVLEQSDLQKILANEELSGKLFGESNTYGKSARVQAVQAKGGEEIVTILADGTKETKNIAKAGDWILTNPGGEQYIVDGTKFTKRYEAAADLGEGWFKPKGTPQKFRQIKADMTIRATWGEEQVLKKGSYVNVTDINDLYGVAEKEFNDTYKPIQELFERSVAELKAFLKATRKKLPSRKRLYERFLKKGTVFSKNQIAEKAETVSKKVEGKTGKAAKKGARKITKSVLPAFATTGLGVILYFGFSFYTASSAQAQNTGDYLDSGDIISNLNSQLGDIEDAEEKSQMLQTMIFVDNVDESDLDSYIRHDTLNGGNLLDKLNAAAIAITAPGFTPDEAAEVMKQAVAEEAKYQLPSYDPLKGIKVDGIPGNVSFD